ncbi:MAG: LysE family transporter [Gemmatimonadaceae bacterium]|nr:LysE family transporter [Acetobacteraceae bacterium]
MIGLAGDWLGVAHGAALGLAVAAPIGPTALLCIQSTLSGGIVAGLATGYGAATAHVIYASTAAVGLALVADAVAQWSPVLKLGCALFLLRMAVVTARRAPALSRGPRRGRGRAYATGLTWTLGNPVTLLGFATLTAGVLGQDPYPWTDIPAIACGVLIGSAGWWTVLATGVAWARPWLDDRALHTANILTGAGLAAFAVLIAVKAFHG